MESTVFVVDDDEMVRTALLRLLASASINARGFASAEAFLQETLPRTLCCLLLDMKMPGSDGFEVMRRLEQRGDAIPIIFISGYGTIPTTVLAMKAGAHEFLTKPIEDERLLSAVEDALAIAGRQLHTRTENAASTSRLETLTPREREVLELAIGGLLNKQIATELGISEITVKVHKRRVMDKMQTKTLADLVRTAERLHIHSARHR
ncbi:response regulator transcription factor [Herbaspirillum sp. AP02]|uniref:response regulator transcription factor n=1 Tax=unclassified Herbaspirillum TaxID=2624150 RepID=UPI0015DAE592|nr:MULTISPECIES: response regulator [unclassified Herbaspirillum]MBG7620148.1 response regulator transcription factor [Herbaspirillum sp. AP02]NZD69400.1 response regulator transcription factor [Herbaspirillum sp. AP21]